MNRLKTHGKVHVAGRLHCICTPRQAQRVLVACWWLLPLGARLHPTTPTVGGTWDPPSLTPVQGPSLSLPHHTSSRSILGHCVPCPFPSHSNATCLTNPPFIPIPTTTTAFPALHSDNRLSFSLQQHQHKHKQTNIKSFAFLIFLIVALQPFHLSIDSILHLTNIARALTSSVKKLPAVPTFAPGRVVYPSRNRTTRQPPLRLSPCAPNNNNSRCDHISYLYYSNPNNRNSLPCFFRPRCLAMRRTQPTLDCNLLFSRLLPALRLSRRTHLSPTS